MEQGKLSNLQKELLKMFHHDIPEKQLLEIRKMLAGYFAKKASDEADRLWVENNWSDDTMEQWANEHLRQKK